MLMKMRRLHRIVIFITATYIVLHLFNHALSIFGMEAFDTFQDWIRHAYRNIVVESILVVGIALQAISGIPMAVRNIRMFRKLPPEKRWQTVSGIYIVVFLLVHVSSVFYYRYMSVDTDFYFIAWGFNTLPLVFIPYYSFAIFAFVLHVTMIWRFAARKKRKWPPRAINGITATVLGVTAATIVLIDMAYSGMFYYIDPELADIAHRMRILPAD